MKLNKKVSVAHNMENCEIAKPEKKGPHEFWALHVPSSPDWEPEDF